MFGRSYTKWVDKFARTGIDKIGLRTGTQDIEGAEVGTTYSEQIASLSSSTSTDPIDQLKRAIVTYDAGLARTAANRVVEGEIDPLVALQAMTDAVRLIGEGFGRGELFLPELVGAAEAMSVASPIIDEEIRRLGAHRQESGTIVIGTVFGDIHSIGKNMVTSLLRAEGFVVHDLGVNIEAQGFIDAVEKHKPDILAMSALLTTTAPEMKKVLAALERQGLRGQVKAIVGGGAITAGFAEGIGADGYGPTAPEAVTLAKRILQR